ncbi:ABC-type antimicrobial peptide transport system permease subunit [Rhodopseudomonas rhenobacensis]|uniref:ABC-type antimicrobial peptide transport system permease subunit n=1 Tax=Rhodopseudomonas rhenobacensis TaxID=87461 RepID=A0A7W8DYC1_9BRAD|nr:hypothetical protein [Rhodopseudomonas rhenobacensis]MBB5046773.1 ABC-type antimicrobial peptide transport system permease subunit [Rhodopseudomonas rhenobacensis]
MLAAIRIAAICLGFYIVIVVAVMITVRARWVHQTYGADFSFADRVEAVMTPALWSWAGIGVALLGVSCGIAP